MMPNKLFAAAALIAALLAPSASAQDKDTAPAQQPRPRVLFIFAPNMDDKQLALQYDKLQKEAGEVDDADLHTIFVIGDRQVRLPPPEAHMEDAANIRKRYHVDPTAFKLVLLGSNGWEKKRWSEPTDPHEIVNYTHELPSPKDQDQK
jgi:hypothetical protein